MAQVICWVLGEYGTADGKHSASYIIGKLCDVAEAHPEDDTVKVITVLIIIFCYLVFSPGVAYMEYREEPFWYIIFAKFLRQLNFNP